MPFLFRSYQGQSQWADQNLLIPSLYSTSYIIDQANLVFYYPFDTNLYNYAAYTTTYVNDGTADTGVSLSTSYGSKLSSGAINVTGSGGTVNNKFNLNIPNVLITNSGYTIAFWIKANTGNSFTGAYTTPFWFGRGTSSYTVLQFSNSNNLNSSSTTNISGTIPNFYFNDTNWHHYCMTILTSGTTTSTVNFYYDNVLQTSNVTCTTPANYVPSGYSNYICASNCNGNVVNMSFNSFVLFNRTLTPQEINYLYNYPNLIQFKPVNNNNTLTRFSGIPCILYFPFDNDTSDYSTGSAVSTNITLGGSTPPSISNTQYKVGSKSLYGTTTNNQSYLQVLNIPTNNNGYTFSVWAYFPSLTTGTNGAIFTSSPGTTSGASTGQIIGIYINGAGTSFLVGTVGNWTTVNVNFTAGKWYHFAFTITKTTPTLNVYLNGVNVASNITASVTYSSSIGPLRISGDARGYGNENCTTIPAYLDDFRYYDGVLSQNQILDLYYYR